ncbi:MAG TPA: glutamine-hydrolyzing carbamoyl-phosphate synthase small subunit [Roseiarcus sp.]|nr:glutamine-hydrolyzing carbamoyl-phosphate synthase small subunit [Roseiarcus sp.]
MSRATQPDPRPAPEDGSSGWRPRIATGAIVLADGVVIEGFGVGATGSAVGEVCFNTAMTGYEEILTDPSYAAQIVTFTFPHIGIVGVNDEDIEVVNAASATAAVGAIMRADISGASNFRARARLDSWMKARGIIGVTGVDTRALTTLIRERGMPNAVIAHAPDGAFDLDALRAEAARWPGIDGMDLVPAVGSTQRSNWDETSWTLENGYRRRGAARFHVVAIDYGTKRNILRLLNDTGCAVTVVPATASAEEILALKPDGVVLSNGPGDPAATGEYAVPTIQALLETKTPLFGVCLGHQLLGLAVGARTVKMPQGHHGANHPVKDFLTGKVEVVSMNHGFAVDRASLPANAEETHVSLFDGSNCGLALADRPAFSVQYHPEASPGPRDSHYLFQRFVDLIAASKAEATRAAKAPAVRGPR